MRRDVILRVCSKLFIPFMMMFGIYVHLHGDFGPGGGFQAGCIIAASVILYGLIFGLDAALEVAPRRLIEFLVPVGVLLYAGVGIASMMRGGEYLNYAVLYEGDAVHGRHWGVFLVKAGVLITVTSTMLAIFYTFAGRGRK